MFIRYMGIKLTIGMATYNNAEQVWWTVMALRLYHDLTDCEIVIIDNYGDTALKNWCNNWSGGLIKYFECKETRGTSYPRNKIFENAQGKFVLSIDSHVMLAPDSISKLKDWIDANDSSDLFHGAMMYDGLDGYIDRMNPKWESNMYGVWGEAVKELPTEPYEIPMHGMGIFGCFKDKWLKFNGEFQGFGGEEGYIHEKYRQAGFKVMCLPFMKWVHRFHDQISQTKYLNSMEERIRNYVIGWSELGLDLDPIKQHFKDFNIEFSKQIDESGNTHQSLNIAHK
jgi:glycosyltransferase involved in cell wall biosynthesis